MTRDEQRFELFKAALSNPAIADGKTTMALDIAVCKDYADASLRAPGLVAEQPQQDSLCPVCDLHKRNCVCPPGGEIDKAMLEQHNDALKTEAATLRAQRDALAEALRKISEGREGCHRNFNGGYTGDGDEKACKAFHHGMDTVYNVLEDRTKAALATIEPEQEPTS